MGILEGVNIGLMVVLSVCNLYLASSTVNLSHRRQKYKEDCLSKELATYRREDNDESLTWAGGDFKTVLQQTHEREMEENL